MTERETGEDTATSTPEAPAAPATPEATGRIGSARAQLIALREQVEAQRDAAVASRTSSSASDDPSQWPVALVPRHRAQVRRTAVRRHRRFEARLRALIAFVRGSDAAADERTLDPPPPLGDTAARVVVATCSACRGACCGNGGDHAFLRTRTLREFMTDHPALDDDGVVAAYRRYLPVQAMHPGCVYQSRTGCTLPREMRSSICNAYVCGGLQQALTATAEGVTRGVFVAHRDGERVAGGRLRALPVLDG